MKYGDAKRIAKKLNTTRHYVYVVKARMQAGKTLYSIKARKIQKAIQKCEMK